MNDPHDWRKPYRSMDAAGSPDAAGSVAWHWIDEQTKEAVIAGAALSDLHVEQDGQTIALYRRTELLAVATIFRDPMNFAVLIRWMAGE